MAAEAGHPRHVVVVLLARVLSEIGVLDLPRGEIHHLDEILDAVEHDPHRARGEAAVPSALGLGRRLQYHHARALLARGQRGAHRRIAGPDHDYVTLAIRHLVLSLFQVGAGRAGFMRAPCGVPFAPVSRRGAAHRNPATSLARIPRFLPALPSLTRPGPGA